MKRSILMLMFLIPCAVCAQAARTVSFTIQEAVERVCTRHPESIAAGLSVDAARARAWKGIAPAAPSLGVEYQYIPRHAPVGKFGERLVSISQSIEFPSTWYLRGRALGKETSMAEYDQAQTRRLIAARVKNACFELLGKRRKLELAQQAMTLAGDFARIAEIRTRAGEASSLELPAARTQEAAAVNALENAKTELLIAEGEVLSLLGDNAVPGTVIIDVRDTLAACPLTAELGELEARVLAEHPVLQRSQQAAEAASLERTIAWSSVLPSFSASYGWQTVGGSQNQYAVSFGISVPVWFMFDQRAQIQEAGAKYEIAVQEYAASKQALLTSLRRLFFEARNNERQTDVYRTSLVPQAETMYRAASAQYAAGESSYLELIQARQSLVGAREAAVDAQVRYAVSLAALEAAAGCPVTPVVRQGE